MTGLRSANAHQQASFADDTPRDPRAPYDPGQRADTVRVVAPVTMPRDAPSRGRTDPGERSTARQRPARRSSARVWLGVGAGALVALVVAVALALPAGTATTDAGPASDAAAARALDAGTVARVVDAGRVVEAGTAAGVADAGTAARVVDAGASLAADAGVVETDPLCVMIEAMRGCPAACVKQYTCPWAKRLPKSTRATVKRTMARCMATCGIDPP
jgi:hypothetical protein